MMSAAVSSACSSMVSLGTITPRSVTSKPLHPITIPVMFLPMSWTSPLTVAIRIRGFALELSALSCSIYGRSTATASRITLADLTTCGRNIFPSAKSSPTFAIPSINGPSITSTALPFSFRHSSMSASKPVETPLTRAFTILSPTGAEESGDAWEGVALPFSAVFASIIAEASSMRRSVAPGSLSRITSSTARSSFGSMSS